jgi:GAF domain-containing protein
MSTEPKPNNAPTEARPASSTLADLQEQVGALTRELAEAREQQTATSEVLQVISSSPGELGPVFQTILETATRLCEGESASLVLRQGGDFRFVASHNTPASLREQRERDPIFRPGPASGTGRSMRLKQVVQVPDMVDQAYFDREPARVQLVEAGYRSQLSVPLMQHDEVIGSISIFRKKTGPFTEKQVELVSNFAKQAVIAVENARLLNELRQRTDDLTESLEQQTATSDVLGVISSSPGELDPVFNTMLENATRLCEADTASLVLREGDDLRRVARYNAPAALVEQTLREPIFRPGPASGFGRSIRLKQAVQVPDIVNDQAYVDREPDRVHAVEAGYRSQLSVPLIKDNEAIGAFNMLRKKTGLFTEKQVELVSNFAKQAVIAIENARLLTELRHRPLSPAKA